jgi:hypothetical protein
MPEITKVVTACGLPSGEEAEWSFWLNASTTPAGKDFVDAMCLELSGDASWKALWPAGVTFGTPKISLVDQTTGTVISTIVSGAAYAATGLGGALPPQCATVVTLRSGFASRSDTGRFYLPGVADVNLTSAGRITSTATASISARMAAAFAAGNGASLGTEVIVYSRTHRTYVSVTAVDVGDVVDTQRRRRDKLIENRVTTDTPWL